MNTASGFDFPVYSGLSGLQLPIPKYLFPKPFENASRLTYYASIFNSIEINSSFYKIPQGRTVRKWAALVPKDFRFTFKLWKGLTHNKDFDFKEEDVAAFFDSVNSVDEKKGSILIQLPPRVGMELKKALESDPTQEWKIAVEFRNKSWYNEEVYDLFSDYKATVVIQDIPRSATPLLNQDFYFVYLMFHGPHGNYRDSYSNDFLKEYATLIHEWKEEGKTIYAYFNNTMGDAFKNANTLERFIQEESK